MREAIVMIRVNSPIDCSLSEMEEWIRFECGDCCQMSMDNPLGEYAIQSEIEEIRID